METRLSLCASLIFLLSLVGAVYQSRVQGLHRGAFERSASFFPERFHRLNVPEIVSKTVEDALECAQHCLTHVLCLSFNFAVAQDVNGTYMCQLLASDRNSSALKFGPSNDSHFYSLQVSTRGS